MVLRAYISKTKNFINSYQAPFNLKIDKQRLASYRRPFKVHVMLFSLSISGSHTGDPIFKI